VKYIAIALALVFPAFNGAALAQEGAPTNGIVYNVTENHAITYQCRPSQNQTLTCDFNQTIVRKKAKPSDLDQKLQQARENYTEFSKEADAECHKIEQLVTVIRDTSLDPAKYVDLTAKGTDPQAFKESILKLRKQLAEHSDAIAVMDALANFCKVRTEDSFLDMTRVEQSIAEQTCVISSNAFTQTFVRLPSAQDAWVVQDQPSGECGVVQLSRFEKAKTSIPSFVAWRYIARKAVTNPGGEIMGGQCGKMLDQSEYVYDWQQTRDPRLGCEFIEFGVF
jgi:hypothetical protein